MYNNVYITIDWIS